MSTVTHWRWGRRSCFRVKRLWRPYGGTSSWPLPDPVSSPFSFCSLDTAVTPHKQCPLGIVTRDAFPSAVFSTAHILSCGSRVDLGAFHRPRELAGTCPRLLELSCVFCHSFLSWVPSSHWPGRRLSSSRGGAVSLTLPLQCLLSVLGGGSILCWYLWFLYIGCQEGCCLASQFHRPPPPAPSQWACGCFLPPVCGKWVFLPTLTWACLV